MINANDLRIGNWVKLLQTDIFIQIGLSNFYEMYDHEQNDDYTYCEHLIPIPLSPEILEKCGFKKKENISYSSGMPTPFMVFRIDDFTFNTHQELWWYNGVLKNQPKYIHQLQNLYFSLTGQELKVTL